MFELFSFLMFEEDSNIYHCHNFMRTLYLNVPSMFETPLFYVLRTCFTDYTNVGQTFPFIFYTSYDNVICNLMFETSRFFNG